MTAPHIVDPARVLAEALTDASPDLIGPAVAIAFVPVALASEIDLVRTVTLDLEIQPSGRQAIELRNLLPWRASELSPLRFRRDVGHLLHEFCQFHATPPSVHLDEQLRRLELDVHSEPELVCAQLLSETQNYLDGAGTKRFADRVEDRRGLQCAAKRLEVCRDGSCHRSDAVPA